MESEKLVYAYKKNSIVCGFIYLFIFYTALYDKNLLTFVNIEFKKLVYFKYIYKCTEKMDFT